MSIVEKTAVTSLESEGRGNLCGTVLIAEDDAICRKILETWLRNWGYRVIVADDGAKAWDILQQENAPELLILDWVMPEIDGTELCRRVREQRRVSYPYILLVTANDEKQDVVRGLEAGADDYLTKPFDANELRARLKVGVRILALQHDLIHSREELRFQATHDALTGILSRGAVLDLLQRELERAVRPQTPTGILMLDVDHFKKINDTYGHLVGDVVLKEVTHGISLLVRSYDLVGRYGGEEFLIVLPSCDKNHIRQTAERIRLMVGSTPILACGSEISVTVSIGATVVTPDTTQAKEILATADAALYQAKNAGRNRTVVV